MRRLTSPFRHIWSKRTQATLLGGLIALWALSPCYGQIINASLKGTVRDASGAVVPQARVFVTEVDTGIVTEAMTDSSGIYSFPSLKPGSYGVRAEKEGFSATVISGITLQVAQTANVDVTLRVGQVKAMVNVKGSAPLVSTTTASMSTVINSQQLTDMPLNLRRFAALALMTPGTVSNSAPGLSHSSQGSSSFYSTFSETTFSANGTRPGSNMLLLDGMLSRNFVGGGFGLQPPPEAIQEFNMQTNVYSAVFGETAGSTLNVVTKSGGNGFHGDVWEFLRNNDLDARNFFNVNQTDPVTGQEIPGTARPKFQRNQFGADVGGPIRRDKIFFFGSYEGLRQVQGGAETTNVPTPAERSGDFSAGLTGQRINLCGAGGPANLNFDSGQLFIPSTLSSFTCPTGSANAGSTVLVGTPVPGNIITTIDPVAQKVLSNYPNPNRPGTPNFVNPAPQTRNDYQFDGRIDGVVGVKDRVFGRYIIGNTEEINNQLGATILPGITNFLHFRGQNIVAGWTHTFGSNLLNEARVGWQRNFDLVNCVGCPRAAGTIANFGIQDLKAVSPQNEQYPLFNFSNFSAWGDQIYQPDIDSDTAEMLEDNLTWLHGRHTITAGANLTNWGSPMQEGPLAPSGTFTFDGRYSSLATEIPGVSTFADLADFEMSAPASGQHTEYFQNTELRSGKLWNAYGQDEIRVSPNFTISVGLRWEWHAPPTDRHGNLTTFYPVGAAFSGPGNGLLITALPDARNDALCTNNPTLVSATGECLVASSAERAKLGFTGRKLEAVNLESPKVFLPRLGFTWRPLSSDRLVVHAGGGLFGDVPNANPFLSPGTNSPVTALTPVVQNPFGSPLPLVNGVPMTTEDTFANQTTINISQSASLLNASPFYKMPTVGEWSFGVESQLATNWGLSVYYIGNSSWHLDNLHLFFNQPVPGVGDFQPRRPYPDFNGFVFYDTTDANSSYNALQAKLTKRLEGGLMFLVSYTYSRAIWDAGGDDTVFSAQNDNNFKVDRGLSPFNATHTFVFSPLWQLPVGNGQRYLNQSGIVNSLVGGWEASAIVTAQTGFPFTVNSANDFSNSLSTSPRPDRVCNGAGQKSITNWFDTSCFSTAALAAALANGTPRFGNSGQDILFGPGQVNWDLALIKHNNIFRERLRMEFRAEFFNAFNDVHFGTPGHTIGTTSAGVLGSAGDPREIQFGLKLSF